MKGKLFLNIGASILIVTICGFLLFLLNNTSNSILKKQESINKLQAIVRAVGINDCQDDKLKDCYKKNITEKLENNKLIYKAERNGNILGLAFLVESKGIFNSVKGIVAVDEKKENIKGVKIYQTGDMLGYGNSLLSSKQWLKRLNGQPLVPVQVSSYAPKRRDKYVDGTTGASKSAKATSNFNTLFNNSINYFISGDIKLEPLDFKLTVDAITKATPGYPKKQVKPPHLKAEIKRPAFLTKPNPRLLSQGKPVTSSMEYEPIIGELEQITDGIKKCGDFDYVEMDPGPQWVQIDLEKSEYIYCVLIWHYYKSPIIYNDVIVQVSNDEEFNKGVITIYNNDHDNSTGQGKGSDSAYYARWWGELVDARNAPLYNGTPARYVRVYTNGSTGDDYTRFVEIEVYGK